MRPILLLAIVPLLGAAPAPSVVKPAANMPVQNPYAVRGCPETPMSLARRQGERPEARRLNELPPALAFAAVDRRVAGCAAPLLVGQSRRR